MATITVYRVPALSNGTLFNGNAASDHLFKNGYDFPVCMKVGKKAVLFDPKYPHLHACCDASLVEAVELEVVRCRKCHGAEFVVLSAGSKVPCSACEAKGFQTPADVARDRPYAEKDAARAARAAVTA